MRAFLKVLVADEAGLEVVEYAILSGLIVVAALASLQSIGGWVLIKFQAVVN